MTIKIHHLRPASGSKQDKIRVGRGDGSKGNKSGRGMKGTKAKKNVPATFEGGQTPLHLRLPKLRGFSNPMRAEYQAINIEDLVRTFPDGGSVGKEELIGRGLLHKGELVKVLGSGDVNGIRIDVTADAFSKSAKEKLEGAGGSASIS